MALSLSEQLAAEEGTLPEHALGQPHLPPPPQQVRVAGTEEVGQGRAAFIAYKLVVGDGTTAVLRRFSAFVDLLPKLSRELEPVSHRPEVHAALDGWKRQLAVEKRHTGSRSRAEAVVTARCQLLQQMLDSLTQLPALATSVEMSRFLASDGHGG